MKRLPRFLKRYFWEVEFEKIDPAKNRVYVLQRILEYGDERAIRWMREQFPAQSVHEVLLRFRGLSPRSANFWGIIFNVDRRRILCLQKRYLEIRRKHWPY